jgi:hypothetical protein
VRREPAVTLAALRVVVCGLVLLAPGLREGVRAAALDPALRVAPEGLGWFAAHAPIGARLATFVEVVTAFAALLALVGIRPRPALVVMTLGATYLYALAQMTGSVWHEMHILWMSALLAASPCADAWAVDAPPVRPGPSRAYAVPLTFARLLLGTVYFFPGFHKLATSGAAWVLSDNLQNQLYFKWAEHGVVPAFRIDTYPWLLRGGGAFVVAFELAAPFLFLFPRTRLFGALLGVAFHLLAQWIFMIPFLSLWACYVVLIDVEAIERRLRRRASSAAPPSDSPPGRAVLWVGSALLAGALVQGARGQMQAFPFACYPTFAWRAGTELPDLRIVAIFADGREEIVPHARDANGYRTQRQWGTIWSLAAVARAPGDAPRPDVERLRAYYVQIARDNTLVQGATRVRFTRAYLSVLPANRGAPPLREVPLAEIPAP